MHNEILTIGSITIYGYGLMIGLGVIAALVLADWRAKRHGLNGDYVYGMTFWTVVLGFVAARILFIFTEWDSFLENPKSFLTGNGFVVYGGIIGGAVVLYTYCRIKKIPSLVYMDLMMPSIALGQALGRVGCFLAGCCYGKETDSCIGVVFTTSEFAPNGIKLIPTQLIMAGGDFLLMAALLLFSRKNKINGQVISMYMMLYSVGRFFVEFLRNDDRGTVGMFSTSQFIAVFIFAFGALSFFSLRKKQEKRG